MFAALVLGLSLVLAPPKPHIVWKPIPYGPQRKAEMAAYAEKHYGIHSWPLHPKVIAEHYTGSNSFSSAWNEFASNTPDPALGELPGPCAHFIVDRDGTISHLGGCAATRPDSTTRRSGSSTPVRRTLKSSTTPPSSAPRLR